MFPRGGLRRKILKVEVLRPRFFLESAADHHNGSLITS
ncbi:hypothetical protein [Klebsiella pneumoniae ISC21]|nr:hypothetical protein [Klebsiella pneumoniae ISC21]